MKSDEDLIGEYNDEDESVLKELFGRYTRQVYNFAYRIVGNTTDAQDVVQETFVKVWRSLNSFDRNRKFKVWLFTIVRNTAFDFLRKKKVVLFSDMDSGVEGEDSFEEGIVDVEKLPDELFERKELVNKLEEAVKTLYPAYRLVLLLHYTNELTFEEIAEIMNKPMNTVKSWHRRAVIKLKELLL